MSRFTEIGHRAIKSLMPSQSEQAVAFVNWAQTHSLADIALRSAHLLGPCLSGKAHDTPMSMVAAMSLVSAVFHDPYYASLSAKRARIQDLIKEAGGSQNLTFSRGTFMRLVGRAVNSDFVSKERTIYNGSQPFADVVSTIYGEKMASDLTRLGKIPFRATEAVEATGFDEHAIRQLHTLSARFVQARLREEIFREFPDLFESYPVIDSAESLLEYLNQEVDRMQAELLSHQDEENMAVSYRPRLASA